MLVSGPVGTIVTGSADARSSRAIRPDRSRRVRLGAGLGQLGAVEARGTVDLGRDPQRPDERPVRAGGDGDVGPAREGQDAQRVAGRRLERRVPADRRDAEQVDLGSRDREEDGERVVVPGVAIEDDRPGHGGNAFGAAHARSVATRASIGAPVGLGVRVWSDRR